MTTPIAPVRELIEKALLEPSVLKRPENGEYVDEAPYLWAWMSHGYDTGMEPFYSAETVKTLVASLLSSHDAEIARLRDALVEIAAIQVYAPEGGREEVADCVRIATAALNPLRSE